MPKFFPPPLPTNLGYKKKKPPNLNLKSAISLVSSASSVGTPSPFGPTQTCSTPEAQAFLSTFSLANIENKIDYNTGISINNGQNGLVKTVTLFVPEKNQTRMLVKKQGGSAVEHENKITGAIRTATAGFPFDFLALPVAQGTVGVTNILYTCYQEIGDLQIHREYIRNQYNLNPSAVLSFLFHGIQQLLETIHALNNTEFKDEEGKAHQGIIHNDIKPSNIFLKTNGNFILGDFGCAYFKDEAASQISTFLFSAPELFTTKDFCIKSLDNINADVWSLGASLWYLLTKELLTPVLPTKPLSDLEKIQFYQDWAEKYSEQWQRLIENHLNLTKKQLGKQIKDALDTDLKNLRTNINDPKNTEKKKKILQKLALLMQAPAPERPNAFELKDLMDRIEGYFIIDGDAEKFAAQLLERQKSENKAYQESKNNNKLAISR
jgi:serine/threonine protein kinase